VLKIVVEMEESNLKKVVGGGCHILKINSKICFTR